MNDTYFYAFIMVGVVFALGLLFAYLGRNEGRQTGND
jgi:hypothetical protein